MNAEFRLPDLGEGLTEAEVVQWLVADGDAVTLNQPIAEVETAKAVVELPSPYAGTVTQLRAAAGDTVAVGDVLLAFEVAAAPDAVVPDATVTHQTTGGGAAGDTAPSPDVSEVVPPTLVGYGAAPRSTERPRRRTRQRATGDAAAADIAVLQAAPHDDVPAAPSEDVHHERPRSTPPVRRLAKELGVDLALVEASGITGIITRVDVEAFAARRALAAPRASSPVGTRGEPGGSAIGENRETGGTRAGETRVPIRGVRKRTAEAMVQSAFTAPHVTVFLSVDVTETMRLVAELRDDRSLDGHHIGLLSVASKAVCLALGRHRELNARWDDETGEIVQYDHVGLGIAVATPRGLLVPVIHGAESLALDALADAVSALTEAARAGHATPADLGGGTFSLTNFGVFGVDAGTPILPPGQTGILGLGAVRRQPWEFHGEIVLRDVLTFSLSFDHRVIDGEQGSRFLTAVAGVLREPGRSMLLQ